MEESLTTLIGSLGFPIVAFLLLFFKMDKTVEKLEQSINNNSQLIQAFIERVSKKDDL
jgi:hypothetical protein